MPDEIDHLTSELKAMRLLIRQLRDNENGRSKLEYERVRSLLDDAIFSTEDLEDEFESTLERMSFASFMAILIKANNPTSDTLGFRFADIIISAAQDTLAKDIAGGDEAKTRLLDTISKIVQNPIVDILLKSNPVGAVASNIIHAASSFFQTIANTTVAGGFVKNFTLSAKNSIDQARIERFEKALEKYIAFYSRLLSSSNIFETKVALLKSGNSNLIAALHNYHNKYMNVLGINTEEGQITEQFNLIFKLTPDSDGYNNYSDVLAKSSIIEAIKIAQTVPSHTSSVRALKTEFARILTELIDDYTSVLQTATTWEATEINKDKLQQTIQQIKDYKAQYIVEKNLTNLKSDRIVRLVYLRGDTLA